MLKKLFIIFLAFLFLPLGLVLAKTTSISPTPTPTKSVEYDFSKMTNYEMFWPIVAGKIPGDRFYSLKLWRDKILASLYFSPLKKSEYLKQLANKRLVEAEKLLELGRFNYLPATLQDSTNNFKKGADLLSASQESTFQLWLKYEYAKDLQKHLVVLHRLEKKVPEEYKEAIGDAVKLIESLIEKHNLQI